MAHNNTQQMEFYDNTSVNHSINVKQSNDVHFICTQTIEGNSK